MSDGPNYENKALFVVVGIRDDGLRKILGIRLAESEDSLFWQDLFEDLNWRKIRATNMKERTNKEIKRGSKVVVAFSNQESVLRLIVQYWSILVKNGSQEISI